MKLENLKKKLVPAVAGAGAAVASCVPVFASESAGEAWLLLRVP